MKPLVLDAKLIDTDGLRHAVAVLAGHSFQKTLDPDQQITIYTVIRFVTDVLDEYKEQYPGEE